MEKKIKVGITGASGYAGIELVRILARHPNVELACVTSRKLAGTAVADNMPALRHLLKADLNFLPSDPAEQAKMDVDVWFLALPHGAAAEYAKPLVEAGKTVTVTFYNKKEETPFKSVVQIRKVNGETGENLAGASMVLKDAEGNVVKTWVTTNEDMIIEDLQPGKYYLSETEAPEGFVLSTEVIEIEVSLNGGSVIVTFFNTPEVEVPDTDSNISTLAIMLGIITVAVGGSIVYINYKKEA